MPFTQTKSTSLIIVAYYIKTQATPSLHLKSVYMDNQHQFRKMSLVMADTVPDVDHRNLIGTLDVKCDALNAS